MLGVLILSANLVLDTSYIFLSTFASMAILGLYFMLLIVRYGIPIVGIIRNCIYKVNEPIEEINDQAS